MTALDWWRQRTVREQSALAALGALLLLSLLFLALEPVAEQRRRLAAELPGLRADLAWMRANLAAARELGKTAGKDGAAGIPAAPAHIEELLRAAGLPRQAAAMHPLGERGMRLSFSEAGFGNLVEFMHRLQEEGRGRVVGAQLRRVEEQDGVVAGELTLTYAAAP